MGQSTHGKNLLPLTCWYNGQTAFQGANVQQAAASLFSRQVARVNVGPEIKL
jgi:hypothetical protein